MTDTAFLTVDLELVTKTDLSHRGFPLPKSRPSRPDISPT